MHRILKTKGPVSLPSFFSFLFFSENSPPAAETAFFKKYPYRDNAARGEKERDEEKRETGVLCKKVPRGFPDVYKRQLQRIEEIVNDLV